MRTSARGPCGELLQVWAETGECMTHSTLYRGFLQQKEQRNTASGFSPLWIPDFFFDFQAFVFDWGVRKGRQATLLDCGMGKTLLQLVFAHNVVLKTNGRVLVCTPLAVSFQTVKEAAKFGIECARSTGILPKCKIVVTNYQQLHRFNGGL